MVHRLALGALLLAALGAVGCSAPSSSAASDEAHPAWLVGQLYNVTVSEQGRYVTRSYVLDADGSAHDTQRSYWPSEGSPSEEQRSVAWSAQGDLLTIGEQTDVLHVAASCHLVQFGTSVFQHDVESVIPGCTHPAAPLGSAEAALVGAWRLGGELLYVGLRDDRQMHYVDASGRSFELAYFVDAEGTLHGTIPDGTDVVTASVSRTGSALTWCKDKRCVALTPYVR